MPLQPTARPSPRPCDRAKRDLDDRDLLHALRTRLGMLMFVSLHPQRRAGVAVFVRPGCRPLGVCHSLDHGALPAVVGGALGPAQGRGRHHPEGRVVVLRYAELDVVAVYAPNNGKTPESFARRASWDAEVRGWGGEGRGGGEGKPGPRCGPCRHLAARTGEGLLRPAAPGGARLRLPRRPQRRPEGMGRVAPRGAHHGLPLPAPPRAHCRSFPPSLPSPRWQWFAAQFHAGIESPRDRGQPGYTPVERERHKDLLEDGDLVDAQLAVQGEPGPESNDNVARPWYTWRGSEGVNQVVARYQVRASRAALAWSTHRHVPGVGQGRGMRIDHVLVSRELFEASEVEVVVTGHWDPARAKRVGFLGSDHCPVVARLRPRASPDAGAGGGEVEA